LRQQTIKKSLTMKKILLVIMALAISFAMKAQWTDDPLNNNFLANCSSDAGEIYTSTDPVFGYTYVQWTTGSDNGWAPWVQCLSFDGTPQWGRSGKHITTPNLASWSPGYAMTATNDGGVVSMVRTADAQHWAVRINADGIFPWGEHGIMLFNGQGGDRSEVMADNNGGVWALGTDLDYSYLQHIDADGTLGPCITLGDGNKDYTFGLMVPGLDNSVLVVFEKEEWAYTYYYEKEIWVVGYTVEGEQIAPEQQLMMNYTMGGSYSHYVVPDGANGGYAYMWHAGILDAFNTYVFHFDEYGNSTIADLNGTMVHSSDPMNFYLNAYGTADPVSHDLIIAYQQTDASTQSQNRIYVNRITPTGECLWGDGILVADDNGTDYSEVKVDAFEDGSGFAIIYMEDHSVQAKGFDMDGNELWTTQMSISSYNKTFCENSTSFQLGQDIVAWINSNVGGIYAQNIASDGTMGPVEPILPCLAPENFDGQYSYNEETFEYGALLTWTAPEITPLHYNLYRSPINNINNTKDAEVIVLDGDVTEYFDQVVIGEYKYQLTAVYEDCESDFALTVDGDDYVIIVVNNIGENTNDEIVSVTKIYTMNGQCLKHNNLEELSNGVYILQGLTQDGRLVSQKIVVNQ